MNERDEVLLRDMLDAAQKVQKFITGKTRADLESNDFLLGFAVVRGIEIVGEAASKISSDTRQNLNQIPWKNIIGMRNRIAHDYTNVDYDIVWEVVTQNLPPLIEVLENLLPAQE